MLEHVKVMLSVFGSQKWTQFDSQQYVTCVTVVA